MRSLKLRKMWEAAGASFGEINGAECVVSASGFDTEYGFLRSRAALSDFSFVRRFEFDEATGLDFLDTVLADNVLKLRYGRIMDTFLASRDGSVAAECFVANIDDTVYVVAESVAPDAEIDAALLNPSGGGRDLTESHVLLSVDGPEAWKVAKEICGPDILNLPYLAIEKYDFEGERIILMRNGKTGEFGYQFMAPVSVAERLFSAISEKLAEMGGGLCGASAHFNARLEGNFFNIYAEGSVVRDPIALGLQWMIDFEKESFPGSDAIFSRRAGGCPTALAGVVRRGSGEPFAVGQGIYAGSERVGEVVACGVSKMLESPVALALFSRKYGLAGFEFSSSENGPLDTATVSMPPIIPLSLQNGLDA